MKFENCTLTKKAVESRIFKFFSISHQYLSVKWRRRSRENLEALVRKTKKTISRFSENRCSLDLIG